MILIILHQMWNQRRHNIWIWLELTLLSVFMWIAIDPLFTMVCITRTPRGYDLDRVYYINTKYDWGKGRYDSNNFAPQMGYLLTQIQEHPMVEEVCLCDISFMMGSEHMRTLNCYRNRAEAEPDSKVDFTQREHGMTCEVLSVPIFKGLEQWADLPGMLRLHDATTGLPIHGRTDASAMDMVCLSSKMALALYGTARAKDSTLFYFTDHSYYQNGQYVQDIRDHLHKVEAVCADIKMRDYETPSGVIICPDNSAPHISLVPLVRLKKGADEAGFRQSMEKDVLPRCVIDDVIGYEIAPMEAYLRKATEHSGAYNVIRLRSAMGFFGLLCAFLGVSGLFWVRCNDRRQDMGVMRAMGATRRTVMRQMLLEAAMLLTIAFVPAMMYMAWHVHQSGYDIGSTATSLSGAFDRGYWFLRPWPHVLSVTAIAYAAMLAVTLLATWLPVQRAVRIEPSDALRDE